MVCSIYIDVLDQLPQATRNDVERTCHAEHSWLGEDTTRRHATHAFLSSQRCIFGLDNGFGRSNRTLGRSNRTLGFSKRRLGLIYNILQVTIMNGYAGNSSMHMQPCAELQRW